MSSSQERDMIDYIDDNSEDENETLFIPVRRDGPPGNWTGFYSGILIGVAGGGLVALAPWLGGALVFAGYAVTALTLKGPGSRFCRALRTGFWVSALVGASILAGEAFFPRTAWSLIQAASDRHVLFPGIAGMPWSIGLLKYLYVLIRY